MRQSKKIKIGVSSCLLGNRVRYDGEHQYQKAVDSLREEFELIPFCPEIEIGLGVPRPKIQLIEINEEIRCVDQKSYQIDYTSQLANCVVTQNEWLEKISGYIFKTKSPSCGLSKVKTDYSGKMIANGTGIFATQVKKVYPELPLIEEDQFCDHKLAAEFIRAVRVYSKNVI